MVAAKSMGLDGVAVDDGTGSVGAGVGVPERGWGMSNGRGDVPVAGCR